jgi:hypothetical protein
MPQNLNFKNQNQIVVLNEDFNAQKPQRQMSLAERARQQQTPMANQQF